MLGALGNYLRAPGINNCNVMAIRILRSHGELGCLERVEYLSPEGEWVQHPTRGNWAPCGTYGGAMTSGGEKITFAEADKYSDGVTAIIGGKRTNAAVDMKNATYERIGREMVMEWNPETENDQEGKEAPETGKRSFPWLLLILVAGAAFVLFRK